MPYEQPDNVKNPSVDYSDVTPATASQLGDMEVANSLANHMPTADMPASEGSVRADPDKIIPGPEAASSVDQAEEEQIRKDTAK